ncbi:tRNA-dihydrouridine synthase [Candidatus Dojkabacteria bacterium]|nr:tRNA-dihydrouridine synthase [Candidatus Dojkabacteria bacterium]
MKKGLVCLAPIDGYTDCAFREIVKRYGNPDLLFTEFVNCQGLIRATDKLIDILRYTEFQRPIIAQLFGKEPEYFYKASLLLCHLGFDGIDINMGCPAKNISSKGGGAALIKEPELAQEIIFSVKKAVKEYKSGKSSIYNLQFVKTMIENWGLKIEDSRKISVSVKTRTGYDEDNTEEWIKAISEAKPDFISLHARTFKQRFTGVADWGAVKRAVKATDIPIIGNGDVQGAEDAQIKVKQSGCFGVMIGRCALGRPWVFQRGMVRGKREKVELIRKIALEHAELYAKYKGEEKFYEMRKHLMSYFRGFRGAKKLREKVCTVSSLKELRSIIDTL